MYYSPGLYRQCLPWLDNEPNNVKHYLTHLLALRTTYVTIDSINAPLPQAYGAGIAN